jgi:hypothetical protein
MIEITKISTLPDTYLEVDSEGRMKIIKCADINYGESSPTKEINLDKEASENLYKLYKKHLMEEKLKKEEGDE